MDLLALCLFCLADCFLPAMASNQGWLFSRLLPYPRCVCVDSVYLEQSRKTVKRTTARLEQAGHSAEGGDRTTTMLYHQSAF